MESYKEQYSRLLSEIEKIAKRFLELKFNSVQEAWQIEIDLVSYQVALQDAISSERATQQEVQSKKAEIVSTRLEGWKSQVQLLDKEIKHVDNRIKVYEHAYQLSRQFGDAIAWTFLGDWLIPLTQGPSEPTSDGHRVPNGHGLKGMLTIAESLCVAGAGFPILHDVTNCLRTGDITFYSPDGSHDTIEVKTHLKDRSEDTIILEVDAHFIHLNNSNASDKWNVIHGRIPQLSQASLPPETSVAPQLPRQLDRRLKRQVERMRQAKIWQSMPPNQLFKLDDHNERLVIYNQRGVNTHNWEIVRELAIKAKVDGVVSRAIDDAFVYTAIYNDSPLAYPWIRGLAQDVAQSAAESIKTCIPSIVCSEREKNYLWIPPPDITSNALPFFVYPLPIDTIMDIMWGRLVIFVIANLGKIVTALEEIGLNARVPSTKEEFNRLFLPASVETRLADNRVISMDLHLQPIAIKMINEFLSLKGFVDQVSEMVKMTKEQVIH